jgi:hypothetical protein
MLDSPLVTSVALVIIWPCASLLFVFSERFFCLCCYIRSSNRITFRAMCLWLYSPSLNLNRFFSFLILYTVGRTPWTGDQPVASPLPTHNTNTNTINSHTVIRTHHSSVRASEDSSCLRARGHCDGLNVGLLLLHIGLCIYDTFD